MWFLLYNDESNVKPSSYIYRPPKPHKYEYIVFVYYEGDEGVGLMMW